MDDLTPLERVELLRVVLDELGGALPIIAGASAPSLAEAIARVQEVQSLGIRQVMIQAPKVIGTDAAAVHRVLRRDCRGLPRHRDHSPECASPARVGSLARRRAHGGECRTGHPHREGGETIPSGGPISAILAGAPRISRA